MNSNSLKQNLFFRRLVFFFWADMKLRQNCCEQEKVTGFFKIVRQVPGRKNSYAP